MKEKENFEDCYMKYGNKIYKVAYKMLNNHQDAVDIVQEVFLRLYKNWHNFKGLAKITTYLYRIAINLSYDYLRKKSKAKIYKDLNYENLPSLSFKDNFEMDFQNEKIINEIKNEIDNLTQKQKIVFILKTYEELTYEEIAKILKRRVGTIKATYYQSLQKIRENLKKKGLIKR